MSDNNLNKEFSNLSLQKKAEKDEKLRKEIEKKAEIKKMEEESEELDRQITAYNAFNIAPWQTFLQKMERRIE